MKRIKNSAKTQMIARKRLRKKLKKCKQKCFPHGHKEKRMTVPEILNKWILPLYWESPSCNPLYNYYGSTGMRLFFNGEHYFVCANHEVAGFDCDNLCIPKNAHNLDTIPLNEKINVASPLFAQEFKDVCFFHIVESDRNNASLVLKDNVIDSDLVPGEELLVLGYPIESNYLDEKNNRFHIHQACYNANFSVKKDDLLSRISVNLPDGKSPQGVSGGAVLRKKDFKLCGMLIKCDDDGLGEFYDARIIMMCLDRIVND